MEQAILCSTLPQKADIAKTLDEIGCCKLCTLRYLGIIDPLVYRKIHALETDSYAEVQRVEDTSWDENSRNSKNPRYSPCVACLGLLQSQGCSSKLLDTVVETIRKADIQAYSFALLLSLPIIVQIQAYTVYFKLETLFPESYVFSKSLKPEGIQLKTVWKWICTGYLREKINPNSVWDSVGALNVQLNYVYPEEANDIAKIKQCVGNKKGSSGFSVSKTAVENFFSSISSDRFDQLFGPNLTIPKNFLQVDNIICTHIPIYIAGRYCKYSRQLSQTPWFLNGGRKSETSTEELISKHIIPLVKCDSSKFTASGREDCDVRMLGNGRPFVFELVNPKRTVFTQEKIKEIQNLINSTTDLISVRDLQIVEKSDCDKIKDGEEAKTKVYCALCTTNETTLTDDLLLKLNTATMPIVLEQNTPIRVLHRRSVACRQRSVLEMSAERVECKGSNLKNLFKLHVKTEAGTYVKEFVHGDRGRTNPNLSTILECQTDILALDVMRVNLDWPPRLED